MTTESDPSILETWTENPAATAAAIGLGLLVGAGITFALVCLATGDEPPIRVRNGSVELEVLHKDRHWKEVGNTGTKWKLSRGERLTDVYQLYLAPTDPADCGNVVSAEPKIIRYIVDDDAWIQVESKQNKTEVTSSARLTLSSDEKILRYGTNDNYIEIIRLDNSSTDRCTFSKKDAKLKSVLTE
jgi:hypothetical protein